MQKINIDSLANDFQKDLFIRKNLKNLDFCFCYNSIFSNTKILRDFIEAICRELRVCEKWKSRLALIVDELNNNAIEYWSKTWENNFMRIKIIKRWLNLNFTIETEDTWNGSHHKTSKEMKKLQNDKLEKGFDWYNSIRWRGLFMIVYKLVDRLYFKDSPSGGLIVWVETQISSFR